MLNYSLNRNRTILFSILAMATVYVIYTEFVFFSDQHSDLTHYNTMRWLLIPHGLFGMVALLLGPFQFSTTLRKKNIKLHKSIGKTYIITILLAAPFAVLLNIYYRIPGATITFVFENITQALVWMGHYSFTGVDSGLPGANYHSQNVGCPQLWTNNGFCIIKN